MPASRNGGRGTRTDARRAGHAAARFPAAAAVLLLAAGAALAHPLAPALLELREVAVGRFEVEFKISALQAPGSEPAPLLPPGCRALGQPAAAMEADALIRRWRVDCAGGLVGQRLGIVGLGVARIDGLVRVALADGRVVQGVVRGDQPSFTVPARATPWSIARAYARLGIGHAATGLDHLLFVAGLLLLARTRRLRLEAVAAFVVGSSLTLAMAALALPRLPGGTIDLGIALSVFWLAVELARDGRARPTLVRRRPYLVAGGFGLLHGLGFASALQAVGLPSGDGPLAVFAFNLGVEAALVAFVAACVVASAVARRLPLAWPAWTRPVPLYAMGSLAALWCFERAAALLR